MNFEGKFTLGGYLRKFEEGLVEEETSLGSSGGGRLERHNGIKPKDSMALL